MHPVSRPQSPEVAKAFLVGNGRSNGRYFGSLAERGLGMGRGAITEPAPGAHTVSIGSGFRTTLANIVLDTSWRTWGIVELASVLVHELGHYYDVVQGMTGSRIVYDAKPDGFPNKALEAQNARTLAPCRNAISEKAVRGGND